MRPKSDPVFADCAKFSWGDALQLIPIDFAIPGEVIRRSPIIMATTQNLPVKDLELDLANYRTVHQPDEQHAVNALITISPNYFWGLMESLLDDGYSPTENIIVLQDGKKLVVKEGNRRIASLKIIHGIIKNVDLPPDIQDKIDALSADWKSENQTVPCRIYPKSEEEYVDRVVARTHGKGETSGRDPWNAIARARHTRDHNKKAEPALDLLEAYLQAGKNHTPQQAERWSGDYPLSILEEAIQKLGPLLGFKLLADLGSQYPKKNKKIIDQILLDIGIGNLGFKELRASSPFWGARYGLQAPVPTTKGASPGSTVTGSGGTQPTGGGSAPSAVSGTAPLLQSGGTSTKPSTKAHALADPKSVQKRLKSFNVRGTGREKIVTLFDEIKRLKLDEFPHAFLFLFRSIFELSAKAYCASHPASGIYLVDKSGRDRPLADLLRDIANDIIKADPQKKRLLHGAMAELGKNNGMLSVTSLNQLVHNPSFSVAPPDICVLFGNVFPLVEEMNG